MKPLIDQSQICVRNTQITEIHTISIFGMSTCLFAILSTSIIKFVYSILFYEFQILIALK